MKRHPQFWGQLSLFLEKIIKNLTYHSHEFDATVIVKGIAIGILMSHNQKFGAGHSYKFDKLFHDFERRQLEI